MRLLNADSEELHVNYPREEGPVPPPADGACPRSSWGTAAR